MPVARVQFEIEADDPMALRDWLCKILGCVPPTPPPKVRFDWKIAQPVTKKENTMLELTITNEQKVKVTLTPVTDTGRPASLDGAPAWTVQSGDSTVVPDEGGLSAFLVSSDTPGDTIFVVTADADLGEGVEELSDTIRLTVAGARAKNLGLSAGTPEPK